MTSKVLCAIWVNASEEIASIGRFWQFFLDKNASWLWMKWYELGLLLNKIKGIIVSGGQADVLVLMNIALCLTMFYKMDALTVLYINDESESLN